MSELNDQNMIKSESEIALIQKAVDIVDETYDFVLANIKTGDSEIAVAKMIGDKFISLGASGLSFDTIVAYGKNGAEPHHVPTDDALESGMLVTIDMGCVYQGYCSDFTRTFAFGQIGDKQREIYDIVYKSQQLGMAQAKAGNSCKSVDDVCRNCISKHGYAEFFNHGTGHGVGQEVHEEPRLSRNSEYVLTKNMVVSVEPGIYLEDEMGVRIEDLIVIGHDTRMSRHSTELIILQP